MLIINSVILFRTYKENDADIKFGFLRRNDMNAFYRDEDVTVPQR